MIDEVYKLLHGVCTDMLDSARNLGALSKLIFVGCRDWHQWSAASRPDVYYRARAIQAAVLYKEAITEAAFKHRMRVEAVSSGAVRVCSGH